MNSLPTESLIHIFKHLPLNEIVSLQLVCHRFHQIIQEHFEVLSNIKELLITNQVHNTISGRSFKLLSAYNKHRIQSFWISGRYSEKSFLNSKIQYIPHLQLTRKYLWHSRDSIIHAYDRKRLSHQNPFLKSVQEINCGESDVTCFKIFTNVLISGQSDGTILYLALHNDDERTYVKQCHDNNVNCLDFNNTILATGSKDASLKIHRFEEDPSKHDKFNCVYNRYCEDDDRILSIALSPNGAKLGVGTTCYNRLDFSIYDTERMTFTQLNQPEGALCTGYSVRDVLWLSDNELITGGFCAVLRLWDLRVSSTENQCVRNWRDPFLCSFYCLDADRQYSILTGSDSHGRVVLWDIRQSKFVQMYYSSRCRKFTSPVYKLSFDACQLYTATDRNLNVFDFSHCSFNKRPKDYRYVRTYGVIPLTT